jgi:hypothetical protein
LKEEALYPTLWRTRFGRDYGPVVRQTTEWMNEWMTGEAINWFLDRHFQMMYLNSMIQIMKSKRQVVLTAFYQNVIIRKN